ncbi:hypothetical protein [Fonticella tunisiensis]|uniref:Uncharacterized protein n=1 Tax=Fonticella tunisiensis TaxID=1096341 RepID=A0A4R7KS42_9CLOT|nr:hypothetical protein [Fonticella tunisiensis]TDT62424.1 hypothetical protein EDD71_104155 [Fonticella tunisiensis]
MADEANRELDNEIDDFLRKVIDKVKENQSKNDFDDIEDFFDEFITSSLSYGLKDGKKAPYFPCDTCKRKQIITEQYNRECRREYIPPYVDKDARDYKLALVIDRIDDKIVEKVFRYLLLRISIKEITDVIDDPEWRKQAESLLLARGYMSFIEQEFGRINKKLIIQILFDINYCYFNYYYKRNLTEHEIVNMLKYYIIIVLRDRIKESLFRIVKIIELELEYKIAVIESEIRYLIKCILQEILITPIPAANYNITSFNKIGSLTDLLKILNGLDGGKHDERGDFRHIRDTIRKYEKVIRTTLELLNRKIKEYEDLISQRTFIVGVTGICERPTVTPIEINGREPIVVPPQPVIVLNPPKK